MSNEFDVEIPLFDYDKKDAIEKEYTLGWNGVVTPEYAAENEDEYVRISKRIEIFCNKGELRSAFLYKRTDNDPQEEFCLEADDLKTINEKAFAALIAAKSASVMAGNGRLYNPFSLNCGDFADIEPIATALSRAHRFWGQTPLTVAQHCVTMAEWFIREEADVTLAHWALLHETAEAFLGDVPTPIKAILPQYKELEEQILERMASCLRLPFPMPKEVKEIDKRIMINEALAFMPNKAYWLGLNVKPLDLPEPIQAWDNGEAKYRFIDCHKRLLKMRGYDYE